jgi:hypothetical protein
LTFEPHLVDSLLSLLVCRRQVQKGKHVLLPTRDGLQLYEVDIAFANDFRGLSVADVEVDTTKGCYALDGSDDEDDEDRGIHTYVKSSSRHKLLTVPVDADGQALSEEKRIPVRGFKRVIYKLSDMEKVREHFHDKLKSAEDNMPCPGGHQGRCSSMKKFEQQYSMAGYCRKFWTRCVASCRYCQRRRGKKQKQPPTLKMEEGIGTLWHWDVTFYPTEDSRTGSKGIFIGIDHTSNMVIRQVITSENVSDIAPLVEQKLIELGVTNMKVNWKPRAFSDSSFKSVTDNGPAFRSAFFKGMIGLMKGVNITIAPYNPQSNGKIER